MKVLKKLLPSSMVAQMVLVVLLALVVAQGVSLIILGWAYRTTLSDINQKTQLRQFESLIRLLEESPLEAYDSILAASSSGSARFMVNGVSEVEPEDMTVRENRVMQRLLWRIGSQYQGHIFVAINEPSPNIRKAVDFVKGEKTGWQNCGADSMCSNPQHIHHYSQKVDDNNGRPMGGMQQRRKGPPKLSRLRISVQMQNGLWLNLRASTPVVPPLAARQTLIFLGVSVVLVLVALAFMVRRITLPLRMLSKASHRLGVGDSVAALSEQGPEDIRETIRAFNQMNDRLQRYVSDRTRMLAALSHDLRTPITTMRLRVEMMPESKDRDQLLATLEEMQQMSEATLAFMRQSSDSEQSRKVDLNAMLGSLCDDLAELGQAVHFNEGDETVIQCRPVSLKRAFRNLIENGVKYGEKVEVAFKVSQEPLTGMAVISIQDYGPGIPADKMEKVFEPFFRLEGSRNRDTGGMGLGMAIARNIIRNHGGDIELVNNDIGLLVKIII